MDQSSRQLRVTKALWTRQSLCHSPSAKPCVWAGAVWTAAKDGSLLRWTSQKPAELEPYLLESALFGHHAPVQTLAACKGAGVVSIDSKGIACIWDFKSGKCLLRRSTGVVFQSASVALSSGLIAIEIQLQSKEGQLFSAGVLALLDSSLRAVSELKPSQVLPLLTVSQTEKGSGAGKLLALCEAKDGNAAYLVGLTQQGLLLLWNLPSTAVPGGQRKGFVRDGIAASVLLDAAFSASSDYLLVVTNSACLVFHSTNWRSDVQHLAKLILDSTGASSLQNGGKATQLSSALQPNQVHHKSSQHSPAGLEHPGESEAHLERSESGGQAETSGRAVQGALFLNEWQPLSASKPEAGIAVLMWDDFGFGQLLWVTSSGTVLKAASFQLPGSFQLPFSVLQTGPHRVAVLSKEEKGQGPIFWQIDVPSTDLNACLAGDQLSGDLSPTAKANGRSQHSKLPVISRPNLPRERTWAAEEADDPITVSMVAGEGSHAPSLLFTGHRSGKVVAQYLAGVLLQIASTQPCAENSMGWVSEAQLGSSICCLLEHTSQVFDSRAGMVARSVLLSGSEDGSVLASELHSGQQLLLLHLHTARVVALSAPPATAPYPWSSHVISLGADGLLCFISLERCECMHLLSGSPPFDFRPSFLWSSARGFITCFAGIEAPGTSGGPLESRLFCEAQPASALTTAPIACLWDFQTGGLDRVVRGPLAEKLIQDLASHQLSETRQPLRYPIQRWPLYHPALHILEVDIEVLLTPSTSRTSLDGSHSGQGADVSNTETAHVLTALAVLHTSGLDTATDDLFLKTVKAFGLADETSRLDSKLFVTADVIRGSDEVLSVCCPGTAITSRMGEPNLQPAICSAEGLAQQLLVLVALAKRLQELSSDQPEDSLAICLSNLAASLTALYTVRLQELQPWQPSPSLAVFVMRFQDENSCVRNAAHTLLAAASDPAARAFPDPPSYSSFCSLILRESNQQAESSQKPVWRPLHIITAAAICMLHSASVPDELLRHAVPGLVAISTARGTHSVLAAGLLSEAIRSPHLARWRQFLGDIKALTNRLLEACNAATLLTSTPPNSQSNQLPSTAQESCKGSPASQTPRVQQSQHPLAAQLPSISLSNGHYHSGSANNLQQSSSMSAGTSLPQRQGNAPGAMQKRDALLDVLASVAQLDLATFLHMLGHRLAVGGPGKAHLMGLMTLVRVLRHGEGGRAAIACHLPLLGSIVLKGLETQDPALRQACRQAVAALAKELELACPMVALHQPSLQLAVGNPLPSGEPISVYDLATGRKKRAVHFRPESNADGGSASETVAALAFSPSGEALAAWSSSESCIRIWQLVASWTHRLQRGPAILIPSQVFRMDVKQKASPQLVGIDFAWSLKWQTEDRIQLFYRANCVGSLSL